MIQRIQTIYLLLAAVCMVLTFFVPLCSFGLTHADAATYASLTAATVSSEGALLTLTGAPWVLTVAASLSALLSLLTIFAYKQRRSQMRHCLTIMVLIVLFYIGVCLTIVPIAGKEEITLTVKAGLILPLAAFAFALLARRAIKKDDDLVRAADRLR